MASAANKTKRWVNLGIDDVEIVIADFDGTPGDKAVVIRGNGRIDETAAGVLESIGFYRLDPMRTIFARSGSTFRKRELMEAFPFLRVEETATPLTRRRYRGSSPFSQPKASSALIAASVPDAEKATERKNLFQVSYRPRSRIGEPIAMIPVNMAEATNKAFDRLEREHGVIDEFVGGLLKMDSDTLAKALSPEQIDAIGLCVGSLMSGREFILADATGLGKGRVLAGLALAARLMGRRVILITEKANLFSDFWRDVSDIGAASAMGKVFLLNSGARIIDVASAEGAVLFEAPRDDVIRKIVRSKSLPPDCEFAMTTYSQFNREGSPKAKFFAEIAKDALVIVDEAHNAVGDSNTAKSLQVGFDKAWGVVRSSATFARKLVNLTSYGSVLPPSIRRDNPKELFEAGGNELAEAMSQYLAEDGVLLRREHDLSGIKINVLMDDDHRDRNRVLADALAPILSRMAKLSRLASDEADLRNESAQSGKGKKAFWYAANFGSRLSPLIRQFVTALTVDYCVERCVEALKNGEKPVVVIESTMESLMRELSSDDDAPEGVEASDADASTDEDAEKVAGTRPPDFRAALGTMLDRIMTISCKISKDLDPERHPVDDPFAVAEAAEIRKLIDAFPDLSLSPIDDLRDRIEAESHRLASDGVITSPWKANEISARRLRVSNGIYEQMPPVDRNDTIVAFNNGGIDALVITRAASTGLSLHASERVKDKRRRRMIELQIPANVVERIQFWGRVNRRGQVSVPAFETLCSGLPLQMRTMAMENRKVEALSANVSASAANSTAMDVPDVMDNLGNEIAQRMLEEQPQLAERMCIAMRVDPEQAEHDLYFINKLLQRLCLLSSDEQDSIFNQLVVEYADALAALKARGQTPRGTRELDGKWKEVSREVYEDGNPADGIVFGRPIDLVTMEAKIEKNPMKSADVSALMAASRKRLGELSGQAAGPYFDGEIKAIKNSRRRILSKALSARLVSVDSALSLPGDNAVKAADQRLQNLMEAIAGLQPGSSLGVPGEDGDPTTGVVVDVKAPDADEVHLPGRWSVRFATPGAVHPKEVSLATILRDPSYTLYPMKRGEVAQPSLLAFDKAPSGMQAEQRLFLDGNLVKAVAIASEVSAGSMVTYTDAEGIRRRSVLVNRRGRGALVNRSSSTTNHDEVVAMIEAGDTVWTNAKKKDEGLILRPDGHHVIVEIPKGKSGKRFETERMMSIVGKFRLTGDYRSARITRSSVPDVVSAVLADGLTFHYPSVRRKKFQSFAQRRAQSFKSPGPK